MPPKIRKPPQLLDEHIANARKHFLEADNSPKVGNRKSVRSLYPLHILCWLTHKWCLDVRLRQTCDDGSIDKLASKHTPAPGQTATNETRQLVKLEVEEVKRSPVPTYQSLGISDLHQNEFAPPADAEALMSTNSIYFPGRRESQSNQLLDPAHPD
ncbi:uncharacterized protein MELLADRAFT_66262 [Melampsora larici-populina 98AG31]|uniref:Uncharacterized protein n=1 Tax=Melampsora larici-populina (strain 98AG31 / pathotype 3-4-7) TaxID=747676 RepID=F4RYH4_MELLP|nr:uncharacterized protein MELLADRAFT_66262 [Melampsora larici-populina 98AG31]EGG02471.1 hypothetical protein MELLADRAFT_66262 [Melampsora larici-populina 98AG31]